MYTAASWVYICQDTDETVTKGWGGGGLKWHHVVHLHQSNVLKTRMRHWQGDVVVDEGWWEEGVCGGGGGGGEGGITV